MKFLLLALLLVFPAISFSLTPQQSSCSGVSDLGARPAAVKVGDNIEICVRVKNCTAKMDKFVLVLEDTLPDGRVIGPPDDPSGSLDAGQDGTVCVPYPSISVRGKHILGAKLYQEGIDHPVSQTTTPLNVE